MGERRVEVVMSWGGTPQGMVVVRSGGRVVLGDEATSTFMLPSEHCAAPFALLDSDETGELVLRVPPSATARVDRDGADALASATADAEGVRSIALAPRTRAEVEVGPFAFYVADSEPAPPKAPLAMHDFASWRWTGVSLAFHLVFLGMLFFMPPSAGALSFDLTEEQRDYVSVRLAAMEEERLETPIEQPAPEQGAQAGQPTEGDAGEAGAIDETRHTGGRIRVRGESDDVRVPLTSETVRTAGALAVIGTFAASLDGISSPYGAADAQGFAMDEAYGALMADADGFSRGFGGLALQGVGRGGGCLPGQTCGRGTVGVGGLGSGFGTCGMEQFQSLIRSQGRVAAMQACAPGQDGGEAGVGQLVREGTRGTPVPSFRCAPGPDGQCASVTVGGLSREQIRLVVTRNRGQIRHCYQQQLQQRPDLAGRLSVRWTIHPEGRVLSADVGGGSDLRSPEVEQCVVRAVSRWQFPASDGATAVTYPFVFDSAG
jgi:TonB family protein